MTCASYNSGIVRADIHNPFLMTQKLHNILALPLAFLFLSDFLYQQLFRLTDGIKVLADFVDFSQDVGILLLH
jgi:hypothetical protein